MIDYRLRVLTLATAAGCAVLLPSQAMAQEPGKPVFATPKRIKAGDVFLGEGRLYPSPALQDVDGDGHADIVIGDLFGKVTFATGTADARFAEEKPFEDSTGRQLKFHNW